MLELIAILGLAWSGAVSYYGESCNSTADCWNYLRCIKKVCVMPPYPPTEDKCGTMGYVFKALDGKVVSQCPPHCGFEENPLFGPRCIKEFPDCQAMEECTTKGLCGFDEKLGKCVGTPQGCLDSVECNQFGNCAVTGAVCGPSHVGCSNSVIGCEKHGRCGFDGERCVPTSFACANSFTGCDFYGYCGFDGLNCVPTTEGCANSGVACEVYGRCGYDAETNSCVATPRGCANSEECEQRGRCYYNSGSCRGIDDMN